MFSAFLFAALGFITMQMTAPVEIAGNWRGDAWTSVSLASVDEADDWYTGSFTAADGQQGALQLEWSRLQRRYNGRWKVGDKESGSITLRAGDKGTIRGAVTVDPDATITAEAPRLWEFAWSRTTDNEKATKGVVIESGVKGFIRWSKGISEGVAVKKGVRIAEIQVDVSSELDHWQEQFELAQKDAAEAEARLVSAKRNLQAMKDIVKASEDRVLSTQDVKDWMVAAREATLASLQKNVEAAEQQLAAYQIESSRASLNYERTKRLVEEGLKSQKELQFLESKYKEAEASVEASKANLETATNNLAEKDNELKTQQSRAQADIETAKVQRAKANLDVVKSEGEVAKAEADLANAQKRIQEWKMKIEQLEMIHVTALFDGRVTDLTRQQAVKVGDPICTLIPESSGQVPRQPNSNQSSAQAPAPPVAAPVSTPTPSIQTVVADNPIAQTFGPVSDLARRLREAREKADSLASDHDVVKADLDKVTQEQAEVEAKIVSAKENAQLDDPEQARKAKESLSQLEQQLDAMNQVLAAKRARESAARRALASANQQSAEVEAEKNTIIRLLESQLDAARTQYALQMELTGNMRHGFEAGDLPRQEALKAEQALAETATKFQQLALLLQMYESLDAAPKPPQS